MSGGDKLGLAIVGAAILASVLLVMFFQSIRDCEIEFLDGSKVMDTNCTEGTGTTYCDYGNYRTFKVVRCRNRD